MFIWLPAVRTHTGTDSFTDRLAAALERRGIEVEVSWLPLRAEYAPWSVDRPATPPRATVAHAASWLHPRFIPRWLPVVATVHLCVHAQESAHGLSLVQRLYHRWRIFPQERAMLARAEIVTTVSASTAREMRLAFAGVEPVVVHSGVEVPRIFASPPKRPASLPFRVLYCGNWTWRKGVDLLAPMMTALGEGFELVFTEDRAGGTGNAVPPPNARSLGRVHGAAAMADVYRAADVLVFPSRHEGLPLVPLEAMSQGLPVVAAASSSVVEIIEDGVSGVLVPAEDPLALASAVRRLREEPELWSRLSKAAQRRQSEKFSLDAMVDRYVEIYVQAIAGFRIEREKASSERRRKTR